MMKKTIFALFGLVMVFAMAAPPKASAQVAIGIGLGRPAYGYVVPAPYVGYPPYYDCGYYPCAYPYAGVVVGGGWYGRGYGYGYGRGYGYRGGGYGYRGGGYGYRGGGYAAKIRSAHSLNNFLRPFSRTWLRGLFSVLSFTAIRLFAGLGR